VDQKIAFEREKDLELPKELPSITTKNFLDYFLPEKKKINEKWVHGVHGDFRGKG